MVFLPEDGILKCEYCDTKLTVEEYSARVRENDPEDKEEKGKKKAAEKKSEVTGFDFASLKEHAYREDAEDLPVYNCISCGAEVIAPAEQVALKCPYCGNNIVLTDKVSGKLRPDAIIPFRISSDKVPEAVRRFYKGKKLLPRGFFSGSSIGEITGVYLPFWLFDGNVKGTVNYRGERYSHYTDGAYDVTEIKRYDLVRDVSMDFRNIPIDASKKADDAIMDSVGPFDLSQARPFDMAYMAGFTADRFDESKGAISTKAAGRMVKSASQIAQSEATAGYSNVKQSGGSLNATLNAGYMLFPLYMFNLQFEGKIYSFAMNGQTGKVAGALPVDKKVSRIYFWTRAAAVAGGLLLFGIVRYLLGF